MPSLDLGAVIYLQDPMTIPPKLKYWVVVCPEPLLFCRLNTDGRRHGSVPLNAADHTPWMDHDCHIECGAVLEADDYMLARATNKGRITAAAMPAIGARLLQAVAVRDADKSAIRAAFATAGIAMTPSRTTPER